MIDGLLRRLAGELADIRNRINYAENSLDTSDFISTRLAVNDAEQTLRLIEKEIKHENSCRQHITES